MAYGTIKADTFIYDSSGSDVTLNLSNLASLAGATFTGDIVLNAQKDLRFADADSSNYVAFQAPATVGSNVVWTLPATDGTAGYQLTTDGSGTLSWAAATNVAAGSLSGTTMAANVVTSSLTTVGTLGGLTIDGDVTFTGASSNGTWDKSADAFVGNLTGTASVASVATSVTVADESSDTSCHVLFADSATGNLAVKSGTNLTFNSSTGELEADIVKDASGDLRVVPYSSGSGTLAIGDAGKYVEIGATLIIPQGVFSKGHVITVINTSGSTQQLTQGTNVTLTFANDGTTGNLNLTAGGICTIIYRTDSSAGTALATISGSGLS